MNAQIGMCLERLALVTDTLIWDNKPECVLGYVSKWVENVMAIKEEKIKRLQVCLRDVSFRFGDQDAHQSFTFCIFPSITLVMVTGSLQVHIQY